MLKNYESPHEENFAFPTLRDYWNGLNEVDWSNVINNPFAASLDTKYNAILAASSMNQSYTYMHKQFLDFHLGEKDLFRLPAQPDRCQGNDDPNVKYTSVPLFS